MGYNLTLADMYLINTLMGPFRNLLDAKVRKSKFPNLTRYMNINLAGYHVEWAYGQVVLCKKALNPPAPAPKVAKEE